MFNKHYINIAEKTSGIAPENLGNQLDPQLHEKLFKKLLKTIEIRSIITKINEIIKEKPNFD